MSYDQSQVAFVDTETTGLDPETDHVWEIGVIVDGEEHYWQQKIPGLVSIMRTTRLDDTGRPIGPTEESYTYDWSVVSAWVVQNTRIKQDYDHEAALTPAESLDRLVNLIGDRHMVGACPWFDSERLHRVNLATYGRESGNRALPWHYHLIDVENLAVGFLAGASAYGDGGNEDISVDIWSLPWDSTDLSRAVGVDPADFQPKHSALADARWAKAIYEAIMGPPR